MSDYTITILREQEIVKIVTLENVSKDTLIRKVNQLSRKYPENDGYEIDW